MRVPWRPGPDPRPPRAIEVCAAIVPWTVVPSGVWRLALGLGIPVGFSGELARVYAAPGWITLYVIVLSLLAEGLALLTLALVRPWGEVVPGRVPRLGGRPIPPAVVAVPAALGAVALTVVNWTSAAMWFGPENNGDPDAPQGVAGVVMAVSYAPLLAWGPLLGVVTVAYVRRRGLRTAPAGRRRRSCGGPSPGNVRSRTR